MAVTHGLIAAAARQIIAPDWYLDPSGGSDTAAGTSGGAPIRTFAALRSRWGIGATLNPTGGVLRVHVASSLPSSDPVSLTDINLGPNVIVCFIGTATTSRTGSITAVTAMARGTNVNWQITDSAMAGAWTADVGKRVRVTSGAHSGAIAWPVKDLTSKKARVSVPAINAALPGAGLQPTMSALSAADPYVVENLPSITIDTIAPGCAGGGGDTQFPRVTFYDFQIEASGVNYAGFTYFGGVCEIELYGCHVLADVATCSTSVANGVIFSNCLFDGGWLYHELGLATLLAGGALNSALLARLPGANLMLDGDTLCQNSGVSIGAGARLSIGAAWMCDNALTGQFGAGIAFAFGSTADFDEHYYPGVWALCGSGNAGAGMYLEAGSTFLYEAGFAALKLTGTDGDFRMANATTGRFFNESTGVYSAAIALSWANLVAAQTAGFGGSCHNVQSDTHVLLISGT